MAKKFMKIVSIVLPFMTVVILASQLLGAPALTKAEMMEELARGDEVLIEYMEPDQTLISGSEESASGYDYTSNTYTSPEEAEIGLISTGEREEAKDNSKLYIAYRATYDCCVGYTSESLEDQLNKEVRDLKTVAAGFVSLPENYAEDYKAWRVENCGTGFKQAESTQASETTTAVAEYGFTAVDETLYATGNVNLRSGPGTAYDKVGSLSAGASVHRVGIGTGTADGWSQIELSDGTLVCVSSNYLSSTKPAAQTPSTPSGSNQGNTNNQSSNQGGSQLSQNELDKKLAELGGVSGPSNYVDPKAGLTEEEIQQILEEAQNTEFRVNGT